MISFQKKNNTALIDDVQMTLDEFETGFGVSLDTVFGRGWYNVTYYPHKNLLVYISPANEVTEVAVGNELFDFILGIKSTPVYIDAKADADAEADKLLAHATRLAGLVGKDFDTLSNSDTAFLIEVCARTETPIYTLLNNDNTISDELIRLIEITFRVKRKDFLLGGGIILN